MVSRLGSERLLGVSPYSFRSASGIRGGWCPRASGIGRKSCSTSPWIAALSLSSDVPRVKILVYRACTRLETGKRGRNVRIEANLLAILSGLACHLTFPARTHQRTPSALITPSGTATHKAACEELLHPPNQKIEEGTDRR